MLKNILRSFDKKHRIFPRVAREGDIGAKRKKIREDEICESLFSDSFVWFAVPVIDHAAAGLPEQIVQKAAAVVSGFYFIDPSSFALASDQH